jgi:anaerobic selenocysteine-containing dehydrogenase
MSQRKVSRRKLITGAGLAAGGLWLSGCEKGDPYALAKPEVPGTFGRPQGEERWVPTVCGQCPAGCGIRVRVVDGRAVKIEGDPGFPINRGGIGPKGQSGLQLLYHPDRIRAPLKRDGPRGSGRWKPTSWDEAIAEIAKVLRDRREKGDSKSLLVLDGEPRGIVPELWDRFLEAFGSPNHVHHRSATDGGKVLAMHYMHGVTELPAYDWPRTRYVLGFGASLFESWCQTIHLMRAASELRRGMPGRRVKFVQVAPRFSITAAKADEWVPIAPATYGALALGLANVLVREGLYDQAFVRDHSFGFEDWKDAEGKEHRGFRDLVLKDYPVARVAEITEVPEPAIVRLAREMADHRPAVALADGNAAAATNGLGTAMAIHALNALLGNLQRPGGMLVQRPAPVSPWPAVVQDETARSNRAAERVDGAGTVARPLALECVQALPDALLSERPYRVHALFLYRSNPVFSKPDGARWKEAIGRTPLVVSFSPLPDESTFWADWVLPDSTYLERWETVEPVPSVGHPILGLRQPVVEPLFDTLPTGEVVLRLARCIGGSMSEAFPWDNYRQAIQERLKGIQQGGTGSVAEASMPKFTRALEKAGGWWDTNYPFEREGAFRTPSGKFEFYSQAIAERLRRHFPDPRTLDHHLASAGITARGDDLSLPHWEPPRFEGDPGDYPFVLIAYRGIEYAEGGARHLPWLCELPWRGRLAWHETVEVAPKDARRLGLRGGEPVRVESPAGARTLRVELNPAVRPGTVYVALGHGRWPPDPKETSPGGYALLANRSDPLSGILAVQGTRVRIRRGDA